MKIALAQLNYHIGNFENNIRSINDTIDKARNEGAELVVFSELSVCGYPPQDLLEHKEFIDSCNNALTEIANNTDEIAILIGAPSINTGSGKTLFNSAYLIENKKIITKINKSLLPTYDIFDEYRYFEPNDQFNLIEVKGKKIALTICEDLWDEQPALTPLSRSHLYKTSPLSKLMKQLPDLIINMAASPFAYSRIAIKREIFSKKAKSCKLPLIYVNQTGAHTELIFEGGSLVYNSKGTIVKSLKLFEEDLQIIDTNDIEEMHEETNTIPNDSHLIHDALITGINDFFQKLCFKKATLGLSGGIDSAVTLVLAERALGKENIRVLLMPSEYSSEHSISDSVQLAEKLGIEYDIVSINLIVKQYKASLQSIFAGRKEDVTEENIQARIRGNLLMALSNKYGHILLNTSNKSEAAVGYGTLYGDMSGSLSVLGDIYKTEVYKLAEYINNKEAVIPQNIISKAPSAELRPDQKDSDSLPEYDLLDQILIRYIEYQKSAKDIISEGFDAKVVNRVIKLINNNEYKRYQAPPMLRVTSKAFGMGRRMPLVAKWE